MNSESASGELRPEHGSSCQEIDKGCSLTKHGDHCQRNSDMVQNHHRTEKSSSH
jgi:hypothetical protein